MPDSSDSPIWIHYLPIVTTVLSVAFTVVILRRYRSKGKGAHLLWWAAGVACFGVGTALESAVTLFGNSVALNKAWYVAGAVFGGYPLAQGTVFLLSKRRTALWLTGLSLPVVFVTSALVILSPVRIDALEPHRPSGAILGWQWVRLLTPLINSYAALFLIGGAALSAWRFFKKTATRHRAIGNTWIAVGAILPGIGGSMAKAGVVEGLYVGELVGIVMIWIGYAYCVRPGSARARQADRLPESVVASDPAALSQVTSETTAAATAAAPYASATASAANAGGIAGPRTK